MERLGRRVCSQVARERESLPEAVTLELRQKVEKELGIQRAGGREKESPPWGLEK